MKPGKHQRRKQKRHELCSKVHDCAQSFVLGSLCMSYVAKTFLLASSSVSSKHLLCFVHGQVEFHNHSPLLTMLQHAATDHDSFRIFLAFVLLSVTLLNCSMQKIWILTETL